MNSRSDVQNNGYDPQRFPEPVFTKRLHCTQLVLLSLRTQAKVDRLMDRPCCSRVWVCAHICVHVCVWHFPVRECAHMCVYVRCIGSKAAFQSKQSAL